MRRPQQCGTGCFPRPVIALSQAVGGTMRGPPAVAAGYISARQGSDPETEWRAPRDLVPVLTPYYEKQESVQALPRIPRMQSLHWRPIGLGLVPISLFVILPLLGAGSGAWASESSRPSASWPGTSVTDWGWGRCTVLYSALAQPPQAAAENPSGDSACAADVGRTSPVN
jgi:hypothetical protein